MKAEDWTKTGRHDDDDGDVGDDDGGYDDDGGMMMVMSDYIRTWTQKTLGYYGDNGDDDDEMRNLGND